MIVFHILALLIPFIAIDLLTQSVISTMYLSFAI